MSSRNIEDIYKLSPMQQGMLFHSIYSPESGVYFEQSTYKLEGDLNVSAFQSAWQTAFDRHTALRTAFLWEDLDDPLQIVYRQLELPFTYEDWSGVSDLDMDPRLKEILQSDRQTGFELSKPPLMRLALIRINPGLHYFVWSHHHLLLDGWSQPVIIQDVFAAYEAKVQGFDLRLEPAKQFRDYVAWLQKQDTNEAQTYWSEYLTGFSSPTSLPEEYLVDTTPDQPEPDVLTEDNAYAIQSFILDQDLTDRINDYVRRSQLTINTFVQCTWGLLLSRYSGENDVVFGATVSGRPVDLRGADGIVGLFINTLPVRMQVSSKDLKRYWLQDNQSRQARSRKYEYSPLFEIQSLSDIPRDESLFNSLLVFENYPVDEAVREQRGSLEIEQIQVFTRTNYPLTIAFSPGKRIGIEIAYDCSRFSHGAVHRIKDHLVQLFESFIDDISETIEQMVMITPEEYETQIHQWNTFEEGIHVGEKLIKLFENQVEQSGNNTALISGDNEITYQELNARVNQLAHYLIKRGIKPDTLVGVMVERSFDMIVSLLGVLKAGGAYLPLDPNYPTERLQFMIQDSGIELLVTSDNLNEDGYTEELDVVYIDREWSEITLESSKNPEVYTDFNNLIYVIYTSGSTGLPKGVAVRQKSLINHALVLISTLEMTAEDRMLQFISLSFDAAAEEIFPTLLSGAALVLPSREDEILGAELINYSAKNKISIIHLPVPIWNQVLDEVVASGIRIPASLRVLQVGGESIAMDKLLTWCDLVENQADLKPIKLINAYGPTEATITSTLFKCECNVDFLSMYKTLPIGKPISNTKALILDNNMKPLPLGAPGELYIGGVGLARGYLHHPDISSDRFVLDPFSDVDGARLYRTGDLARYLPDGNIEFLGRTDFQVKLRGYRVELGEIEVVLREHPEVRDALTMIREDSPGDRLLVGYFIPEVADDSGVKKIEGAELRSYLLERLPQYMVPGIYIQLDKFPLTPSGKIDRKAFPEPPGERPTSLIEFVSPRNAVEEIVAGVWMEVLGIEKIGVHDNFFDLGGHSLKATQLLSRLRQTFDIDLALREVFEAPTVAGTSVAISTALAEKQGESAAPPITTITRDEISGLPTQAPPLSFSQQRLWFLEQLDPGNLAWNIPLFVRIKGDLDGDALSFSVNELIKRHEILRTTFDVVDGLPNQIVTTEMAKEFTIEEIQDGIDAGKSQDEIIETACRNEVQKPFDLETGPLFRIKLLRIESDDHILILTLHHIIADGWSLSILINELAGIYHLYSKVIKDVDQKIEEFPDIGSLITLPELPIQYADFAVWQRGWLQGEALEQQMSYWKERLAGIPPVLDMPTDRPRPAVKTANGASENFFFPPELSEKIISMARMEGVTPYMFLLAAFYVLLNKYSGQDDISIGTAIANRTREELEGLIGFFVNTLVMRGNLSGNPTFRELLMQTRETALGAYAHQDLPFEMLVEELQPDRNLSYTPLFQVGFDYQDAMVEELNLSGISIKSVDIDSGTTPYDLLLSITHTRDLEKDAHYLGGTMEFNTDLYHASTIDRMLGHFRTLLSAIVLDLDQHIANLQILTNEEQKQILLDWNATIREYPDNVCIHQRFESQVVKNPQQIAITYRDERLTYDELNRKSNQLANYLRNFGVGSDVLVGISTDRSPEMIVSILAVLKAGGAYLPLDPGYPKERIEFMITDSGIQILLTQESIKKHLPDVPHLITVDQSWGEIFQQNDMNLPVDSSPGSLAYVIYTSGSTGLPKGTMLRHQGLCNLAETQRIAFNISKEKRVLQFSPFSFDASVWETFMALANGGTLCLAPQEVLASGVDLIKLLKERRITTVTLPPSLLSVLPPEDISHEALPELDTVIAAGEACTRDIVKNWAPGRDFYNAYGPTETTVCASMKKVDFEDIDDPPIGRPIANTQLFILNNNLQPVPVGVPGELFVGGVSLARGYLNRPKMTSLKFIPSQFDSNGQNLGIDSTNLPNRLYSTGDLVRYRENGDIEFLGRIDNQVKVRGHRIELGEIEAALRGSVIDERVPILDGVVIVREDVSGNQRMVAYLITEEVAEDQEAELPSSQEIKQYLRKTLPEYMVPSSYVFLESYPISPAGKIDRIALGKLPPPDVGRQQLEVEYLAPRNEFEEQLAEICATLLGLESSNEQSPIGVYDNFFELGGHSLLATQFISRVRESFNVELPLRTLFEHPTIAEMAIEVEILQKQGEKFQQPAIQRVSRDSRRRKRSTIMKDDEE